MWISFVCSVLFKIFCYFHSFFAFLLNLRNILKDSFSLKCQTLTVWKKFPLVNLTSHLTVGKKLPLPYNRKFLLIILSKPNYYPPSFKQNPRTNKKRATEKDKTRWKEDFASSHVILIRFHAYYGNYTQKIYAVELYHNFLMFL